MAQPTSPAGPPRWTVEERGSFAFGHCPVCGFRSPGRRAQSSVETDMEAHVLLCDAAASGAVAEESAAEGAGASGS